ncbi:MAG: TfoX/Sxy family protein [Pseudomonadota bacterium]
MAKPPDPFHEFVIELFAPLGPVTVRRMFGGAGVFADGVMFALLADGEVYLKTDAELKTALEAEGSEPFVWTRPSDGKDFDMGYLKLPSDAAEDPEEASAWGRRALDVALKAKSAKTKSR